MALNYDGELTCSLGVTDMTKSIAWYQEVLDFKLLYKVDDIGWCELSTGMSNVTVGLSQVEQVTKGGGATNVFGVDDIDTAKQHLDAHDVRQDGEIQHIPGLVKLLTFYDPDGNAMMLAQNLSEQ